MVSTEPLSTTTIEQNDASIALPLSRREQQAPPVKVRIAIVGVGFFGLGVAIGLKRAGIDDFVVLERATESGGTWRDNSYPGCACDVQSDLYAFSFAPNPDWRRLFSPQAEIWDYLRHCVERFGIGPHLRWGHEVLEATWDDDARCWQIRTTRGQFVADVVVFGVGPLSEPAIPDLPALDSFAGTICHSARWDHQHDLAGERVAVIGTGASAVQFIPRIQPSVDRLLLFQRTPPWVLPRLDGPVSRRRRLLYRLLPAAQQLRRFMLYWRNERTALGMVYRPEALAETEQLALRFLRHQVPDPVLRQKLVPDYRLGCKRILLADDYYPALTRENVEVLTGRIREVRPDGVVTEDGVEHAVDTIILATGFRATDPSFAACVRGRHGRTLAAAWHDGPTAYLGITVTGFPNLFLCLGPNTGLGHSSVILMIEAQMAYIIDCLRQMARRRFAIFEIAADIQARYNAWVQRRLRRTIWLSGCRSWYLAANGRNTTLWPGFTWEYRLRTRRFDAHHYLLTPSHSSGWRGGPRHAASGD